MKAVLQRVQEASVSIDCNMVSNISNGFLVLLGVEAGDEKEQARILANKTAALRVFEDEKGKLNLSTLDVGGSVLVVSNFTLCADCKKGKRPSFTKAALPGEAKELYETFCRYLSETGIRKVATGIFGADMKVSLINDGPVTILLDTKEL